MLQQLFVGAPGREISVVYRYHGPTAPAVVICPGLGNSMSEPRYLFSILARQAYDAGFSTFQFDYVGDGDSSGDCRATSWCGILESGEQVIGLARKLGAPAIHLVGYGMGNLVAGMLESHSAVHSLALINPRFAIFSKAAQQDWKDLRRSCNSNGEIYPAQAPDGSFANSLWEAIVGEPFVPTQPCGPLSVALIDELLEMKSPSTLYRSGKPIFIVSERQEDRLACGGGDPPQYFQLVQHTASRYKPTWHWCADCRALILSSTTDFLLAQMTKGDSEGCDWRTPPPDAAVSDGRSLSSVAVNSHLRSLVAEVAGEQVLAVVHLPKAAIARDLCVIYEAGMPGQRVDIHRCGPRLATLLVNQGFFVCRYDPRGMGVSAGEFHRTTWTSRLADCLTMIELLSQEFAERQLRFAIVGHSAGARVACLAANREERMLACITWGPVMIEPSERIGEHQIRRHPSGSLVTEYCGLWMGINYNLDERRYDFLKEFRCCRKPGLVAFADGDREHNPENEKLLTAIVAEQPEKELIRFAGPHGFSPEAFTVLLTQTTEWLVRFDSHLQA